MKKSSSLFSMLLFLVFLFCALFTVLIGSRVYENIRARNNDAFYTDTALSYITNKVRQKDSCDFADIRDVDGCQVLVLSTTSGDAVYETWIYSMDGTLKELFTTKDSGLSTEDGLDIMDSLPVGFSLEQTPGGQLLTISLGNGDGTARLLLRSSAKKEA